MNKEWSELNKVMQVQLKKEETFKEGIKTLFKLRQQLFHEVEQFNQEVAIFLQTIG